MKRKGGAKVAPEVADDSEDAPDVDADPTDGDDNKAAVIDPERDETLNILNDLVQLSRGPKTASAGR